MVDGGDTLTCWPKGFLTEEEGQAIQDAYSFLASETANLTTEDQMALEKVQAAMEAKKDSR